MTIVRPRIALVLPLLVALFQPPPATAETPEAAALREERAKQDRIYHGSGEKHLDFYVVDRGLADYTHMFGEDFDRALAALRGDDRWLDIGAGMGLAMIDYLSPTYRPQYAEGTRQGRRAGTVAMSIEDRRTAYWHQLAAYHPPGQMQYVFNKRLREYSREDLGQFQLITDVIGGFSYSENLSLFMEKTLGFLTVNGMFFTALQDVRHEAGKNKPHYGGPSFLTELKAADGSDVGVCAWLKSIRCVAVTCAPRSDWRPPLEVYRIRKTCDEVVVPRLEPTRFVAGTPPERGFRLSTPAAPRPAP